MYTTNTKLMDILREHPWLEKELQKKDSRCKLLFSPLGKKLIRSATIADLGKKIGVDSEVLLRELQLVIDEHDQK